MDFPYMKTEEDVTSFTSWVAGLKIKKVQGIFSILLLSRWFARLSGLDWWKHKLQYPWILPSIIKSRSRILPADWDITEASTNLNEGQHHWTNQQTGVNLSLLEAIETCAPTLFYFIC
jgi:hypothetical protein